MYSSTQHLPKRSFYVHSSTRMEQDDSSALYPTNMLKPGFTPNFFLGLTGPRGGGIILSPIPAEDRAHLTQRACV